MIHFYLNVKGELSCKIDAESFENIMCRKAFPLDNTIHSISILSQSEKEIAWLSDISKLDEQEKNLIIESLKKNAPIKRIQNILNISSIAFPNIWSILVAGEKVYMQVDEQEDLFFYTNYGTLIKDSIGEYYLIPMLSELDEGMKNKIAPFIL